MSKIASATFGGKLGSYGFGVYTLDSGFNNIGAVYIFTERTEKSGGGDSYKSLYIGETAELGDRLANHEKLPCVTRYGATHICIHPDKHALSRLRKEKDLLDSHNPPCNIE